MRHLLTLVLIVLCFNLGAQVTIGIGEKPADGALLQLKNIPERSDGSNATGGLLLPRVELSDLYNLYPMFEGQYAEAEKEKHMGMLVLNVAAVDGGICKGLYVWNGDMWESLDQEPCFELWADTEKLLFYKTAPHPKQIVFEASPVHLPVNFETLVGGQISWRTTASGFPSSGTLADGSGFEFHPQSNTTTGELNSVVIAKVQEAGKEVSKRIEIKQLERDPYFEKTKTNPYAAAGGNFTMTVDSETNWELGQITGTQNMVTYPGASEVGMNIAKGSDTRSFTLAGNPLYVDRDATLKITSTSLDFVPQQILIQQASVKPYLNITNININASNQYILDFGQAATAKPINFSTNAGWTSSGETNYGHVVSSTSPNLGVAQTGSASAIAPVNASLSITPTTAANFAAGTVVDRAVNLTTINHAGANADTKRVILRRTVPKVWTGISFSHGADADLARAGNGATVTAYATTNANWYLSAPGYATQVSQAGSASAAKSQAIRINDNNTWARRYVTVSTWAEGLGATNRRVNQHCYDIGVSSYGAGVGNNYNGLGGTPTMTLTSTHGAGAFSIRIRYSAGTGASVIKTASSHGIGSSTFAYTIAANPDALNARTVYIDISRGGAAYVQATAFTQQPSPYYILDHWYVKKEPTVSWVTWGDITARYGGDGLIPGLCGGGGWQPVYRGRRVYGRSNILQWDYATEAYNEINKSDLAKLVKYEAVYYFFVEESSVTGEIAGTRSSVAKTTAAGTTYSHDIRYSTQWQTPLKVICVKRR